MSLSYDTNDEVTKALYALSLGPLSVTKRYDKVVCNGVRWHTEEYDCRKRTQNSGVVVEGYVDDANNKIDYYGVLTDVIEIPYAMDRRAFIFKCKWWDLGSRGQNVKIDGNIKSIKVSQTWYANDPFVLASQARQVFYLDDLKLGVQWRVVQHFSYRHLYNIGCRREDANLLTDVEVSLADDTPVQVNEQYGVTSIPIEDTDVPQVARTDIGPEFFATDLVDVVLHDSTNEEEGDDTHDEDEPIDDTLVDYDSSDIDGIYYSLLV